MPYKGRRTYRRKNLATRVTKLERTTKPEMKQAVWSSSGTLAVDAIYVRAFPALNQGDAFNQRIGNQVRLHKIDCKTSNELNVSHLLIKANTATPPTAADFVGFQGSMFVLPDSSARYQIIDEYQPSGDNAAIDVGSLTGHLKYHNSYGTVIKYRGGSGNDQTGTTFYYVCINKTSSTISPLMTAKIYYSDY